jgi:hypothetical protein
LALTAILLGIKLIELLVKALWGEDYLFFERVNLKYVFDIFDLAIVVFFLISGVYLVGAAYVKKAVITMSAREYLNRVYYLFKVYLSVGLIAALNRFRRHAY